MQRFECFTSRGKLKIRLYQKIMVNPLATANPCLDQVDPIEIPELYPGCAITRAMAKKALSN